MDIEVARIDASQRDEARHSLTTAQAAEIFAQLGVPRSKRSVQRFCESGHLDFVSVKGPRGDEFFISRKSVERYAEELRQIDAIASIGDETRHDALQHDMARHDAPQRDNIEETPREPTPTKHQTIDESVELKRRDDEILNLRIDNRAKEQVITMLRDERQQMQMQLQDVTYRLGASETRVQLLEAAKPVDDVARQATTDSDSVILDTTTDSGMTPKPESAAPTRPRAADPDLNESLFRRLFR